MEAWVNWFFFLGGWIGWIIYAQRRKWSLVIGIGGGLFVALVSLFGVFTIGSIISGNDEAKPLVAASSPVVYNSSWDGSVKQVETWIKKNLNDADSFKVEEWSPVVKMDDGYVVRCKFRAKNAYGALMLSNAVFKLDQHGNVIDVSGLN